ncbi:MAG TPA: glycosyltransferase [Oligoflexia bacterium]|nr:glycosyltransferase [Oligoflexia bacterium]
MKLFITTPVYFDVPSFRILRDRVRSVSIQSKIGTPEFLVIDDSGGNDTEIDSLRNDSDTRIINVPFNMGSQRAFVYSLRLLCKDIGPEDIVVTMDADGEDQPEHIPALVETLNNSTENNRVVLARRKRRRDPYWFKVGYVLFKWIFRGLIGTEISTGNFAAMRGHFVQTLLWHPHFDLVYAGGLVSVNTPKSFVPCERGPRYAGESKMTYLNLCMHAVRMLMPFLDRIAIRAALFSLILMFASSMILATNWIFPDFFSTLPKWLPLLAQAVWLGSGLLLLSSLTIFISFIHHQSALVRALQRSFVPRV